jgi:hypothetical protein
MGALGAPGEKLTVVEKLGKLLHHFSSTMMTELNPQGKRMEEW